ncbi:MAG: NusG domain II-containing protein [Lachnospiraceae bacterium]|nr:NusG domain II-containing protein [Lachnospiraceae bacterium]
MEEKRRQIRKADLILTLVILALALGGYLYMKSHESVGAEVVVTVNQEEYARLPLGKDATLEILSEEDGRNYLVIKDGIARVTEANCPDKICVRNYSKGIRYNGETIVCLPHKMVVTVMGGENNPDGLD